MEYMRLIINKKVFFMIIFSIVLSQAFTDENFELFRDTGFREYFERISSEDAQVRLDNFLIQAEHIEIQGDDNQFIDFIGNVRIIEEEKNLLFFSDRLRYDRKRMIFRLEGNSKLEDKENGLVARGNFIEYDIQAEIAVFHISVRIFKNDMVCHSEFAVYRRIEKLMDLSGFPVVFQKDDEFRADRIRIDLETDDIIMENHPIGIIRN